MIHTLKYSLIMYATELLEEDIEYIIDTLKNGIIIHLFLITTLKNELDLNEYSTDTFDDSINNKLLFLYENQQEVLDHNEIIAYDSYINNLELYNILCKDETSEFNYNQYEIITANEDSSYIIVSGAGTGKTTTMINRLIYLRKTSPRFTFDKAALITFTNKASREMRERLIEVLGRYYKVTKNPEYLDMMDEASRCDISTIHRFSKKLINEYGKSININKNIQVKSFKYFRKKAITKAIDYLYKNYRELYEIIKYYPHYDVEAKLLLFWEKLDNFSIDINSSNYTVEFDEGDMNFSKIINIVISKAQQYLEEDKGYQLEVSDLMKKLSYKELFFEAKGRYDLIMVDEFQDSDNIQIDFVANFCNITGAKLMVVGDEKQSIYRFRGAEHTAFSRLRKAFNNNMTLKGFTMVRNYRTDTQLLKDINEIFINIDQRVDRFSYKKEDYIYSLVNKAKNTRIQYVSLPEYNDEAANFYDGLLKDKGNREYVAVLFRNNHDIKEFKEFCDKKSIPCRVDVSGSFYRHESVRDFYVMLKALIDSTSNSVMYSFIETPYINKKVNKQKILLENNEEINDYLSSILNNKNWTKYQKLVHDINTLELIDLIVYEMNPIRGYYIKEYLSAKANGRRDAEKVAKAKTLEYKLNLEHLIFIIKENFSDKVSSILAIEEFLRLKISTDNSIDVRKPSSVHEKDFLQCLTVHKAKGLEYDYVILPKLTNQFILSKSVDVIIRTDENTVYVGFKIRFGDDEYKNSYYKEYLKDEKSEIIGEEARLLYVAMTRCKKELYLNSSGLAATEGINNWKSLIGGARAYV